MASEWGLGTRIHAGHKRADEPHESALSNSPLADVRTPRDAMNWAQHLQRVYAITVLICPACAGAMQLILKMPLSGLR